MKSYFIWDPEKTAFTLPIVDRPVAWYGVLFVLGFFLGYWVFLPLLAYELKRQGEAEGQERGLADLLLWYLLIGAIVGARAGHVLFYDWPAYRHDWMGMLKIWEGGLASHGGTVGAVLGLILFRWRIRIKLPRLTFLTLLDLVCIPTALAAALIRVGNFINQEIVGVPSDLPWAVVFLHPADGSAAVARHPVQLYEALLYLATFCALLLLWRWRRDSLPKGVLSGLFFTAIFAPRIVLESYKLPQSLLIDESYGMMGQYLSIPFILFGLALLFNRRFRRFADM